MVQANERLLQAGSDSTGNGPEADGSDNYTSDQVTKIVAGSSIVLLLLPGTCIGACILGRLSRIHVAS